MRIAKPLARSEDLVIEELEDEVLVYDAKSHQAHCLASAAAKVWRACDGTKDVPALAESLALSVDDVTRALETLDGVELLESQGLQIVTNGDGNGNGLTRRELGRRSARPARPLPRLRCSIRSPYPLRPPRPRRRTSRVRSSPRLAAPPAGRAVRRRLLLLLPRRWRMQDRRGNQHVQSGASVRLGGSGIAPSLAPPATQRLRVGGPAGCCGIAAGSRCGCAFAAELGTCATRGAERPAGCAAICTPGAPSCGPGCCDPATCPTVGGRDGHYSKLHAVANPASTNCVPCCNGARIDPGPDRDTSAAATSAPAGHCPPLVT